MVITDRMMCTSFSGCDRIRFFKVPMGHSMLNEFRKKHPRTPVFQSLVYVGSCGVNVFWCLCGVFAWDQSIKIKKLLLPSINFPVIPLHTRLFRGPYFRKSFFSKGLFRVSCVIHRVTILTLNSMFRNQNFETSEK